MPWKPVGAYGFLLGLLLFLRGFFLTRRELGKIASLGEDCSLGELVLGRLSKSNRQCGTFLHRRQHRALLLIVDGLRYDLTTNETHFPFLHYLLRNNASQTRLFAFQADPPTVTAQRLKGLTTGTLPTFVDMGSNLNSSAITDDNLIDQLRARTDKLVVLGDDTWKALFPHQFLHSVVFDSFNTKDIDSVDDGILLHLPRFLRDPSSWKLLVAHFLGADHIGHSHHAFHPLMTARLQLMDQVLREAILSLPRDGVLFLFGDHGMTDDGEHGGSSPEETNSALFVYFPTPQQSLTPTAPGPQPAKPVPQIDLVPTLAALLDIPIPFSSLGKLIPSFFDSDSTQVVELHGQRILLPSVLLEHASRNALQVWRYLHSYFPHQAGLEPLVDLDRVHCAHLVECISSIEEVLQEAPPGRDPLAQEDWLVAVRRQLVDAVRCHLRLLSALNSHAAVPPAQQHVAIEKYLQALQSVQDSARRMWTQFHGGYALCGLAVMALALAELSAALTGAGCGEGVSREDGFRMAGLAFHVLGAFSNSFIAQERAVVFAVLQAETLWHGLARARTPHAMISTAVLMLAVRLLHTTSLWSWLEHWSALLLVLHCMACMCVVNALPLRRAARCLRAGYLGLQLLVAIHHFGWLAGVLVPRVVLCGAAGLLLLGALADCAALSASHAERAAGKGRLLSSRLLLAVHVVVSLFVIKVWHCAVVSCALALLVYVLRQVHCCAAPYSAWRVAVCCSLWARWAFFATEHALQVDRLHLSVAFVGMDSFQAVYAGAALLANTCATEVLAVLAVSSCADSHCVRTLWAFLWIRMALALAASMAAWVLRRHLMLWAMFVPKLVFEMLFVLVAQVGVLGLVWGHG